MGFEKTFQVIWADIDANRHLRHSAYNDYAAQTRLSFFDENGYPFGKFAQHQLGPVLFREETIFLKEVGMNETITVTMQLAASRKDGSRWRIVHTIFKKNGETAATITVDGAWIDLVRRKLIAPPQELLEVVDKLERTENYEEIPGTHGNKT